MTLVQVDYSLDLAHGHCWARATYATQAGVSPVLRGLEVFGPCVQGAAEAEAHGFGP